MRTVAEPDPGASTVLIDELDAGGFEGSQATSVKRYWDAISLWAGLHL